MLLFRRTILFLILLELLSLASWLWPTLNTICFGVILVIIFLLSFKNLAAGLLFALGELIIGSHGYLFSLNLGQGASVISIRLGIFIIVLLAWALHTLRHEGFAGYWHRLKNFQFFKYYLLLAVVLAWGFFFALLRGNDFGNIFLDFNNWLFFLYLLPLLSVSRQEDFWPQFRSVALGCLTWLIVKTFLFFYIFSHQFIWALPEFYRWIRDTRVGEITQFKGNFYRVFLQSQIYCLLAFFVFLPRVKKIFFQYYSLVLVGCLSVVFVSFSRSFWAGFVLGLFISVCLLVFSLRFLVADFRAGVKKFWAYLLNLVIICFASFVLIFTIAYAPPKADTDLVASLGQRATEMEAAGSSRLNMLKPLLLAIVDHPVIGSGFGTTVTYQSSDPRVVPATAGGSGEYTTYAFEWGYLDLLLKIGLAGLFIYLLLIYKLLHVAWAQTNFESLILNFKINPNFQIPVSPAGGQNSKFEIQNLSLGLILALLALLAVNIFTPYLNHPLGIGFILVVSVWLNYDKKIIIP